MLERPGRTQIRSENFTAKRPGISGRQPTLCSRAANQHPPGILQRFPCGTAFQPYGITSCSGFTIAVIEEHIARPKSVRKPSQNFASDGTKIDPERQYFGEFRPSWL